MLIIVGGHERAQAISKLADQAGLRSHAATEAGQVRELLARHAYDLVVLDMLLPGESALQVLSLLRQAHPGTAVVALCENNTFELERLARRQGVVYYMAGPFDSGALQSIIGHMSGQSKGLEAGRSSS